MRSVGKLALTIVVVTLAAGPALAQRGQFGGGGFGGPGMLLQNKSVQQELKLTEEQTGKIRKVSQEIRAKYKEEFEKAQQLEGDEQRQKFQELGKKIGEETNKALADILKAEQTKRFKEIQLQVRGPEAFTDEQVGKDLKLTDDQKDKIKTIMDDFRNESGEIFKGAQGDFQGAMKKIQALRKETLEKVTEVLTDDQKKNWKEMTGKPFELKMEGFGRPGGGGGKKKKAKDKDKEI